MKQNFVQKNLSLRNKVSQAGFVTYFVIVLLFLGLRLLSAFGLLDFIPSVVRSVVTTVFIQVILMFTVCIFMFSGMTKQKPKDTLKFFGFKKISGKAWLFSFILGVIIFFLNSYIASFFSNILEAIGFRSPTTQILDYPWWLFILNIFLTALLPAICEETAHRGMLLKSSLGFGATKAIVISALLFGLLHMNIQQFFYATIIGLYLGFLAMHCDSIFPGIVIHFMNNALSVLMTFSVVNNLGFSNILNKVTAITSDNLVVGLLFNAVFLALLVMGLIFFTKKLIHETSEARVKDLQAHIYNDLVKQEYMENISQSKRAVKGEIGDKPEEIYVDVEEMFLDKNIKLGYMTKLDRQLIKDETKYKPDFWTITTMTLSFVIGVAVTIFTLIWGLL